MRAAGRNDGHVCAGKLDTGFAMPERVIAARRFFFVDPWLDETARFRPSPAFDAVRERVGVGFEVTDRAG